MLRLNAKHIEVLKLHILLMSEREQHSSSSLSVPLFPYQRKKDQAVSF